MRRFIFLVVICGFALGCGGGEKPRVPVAGRVLYKGYAVSKGQINFMPDRDRGHSGDISKANLSPDGSFRIGEGGLAPGWYRITIASMEIMLPGKYRDPDLTNIVREVVSGKENWFEIVLDD